MTSLNDYYNKFNEDKRLNTRRGQVEYLTTMKYIYKYLKKGDKILDVGAGTGKYSLSLFSDGYDVTALELVKHNLNVIKKNNNQLPSFLGDARDLSRFDNDSFDVVLLFGPLYHLHNKKDQLKVLQEAKRVVKTNGIIMVTYCMNEYAIITHGFKDHCIKEAIAKKGVNDSFHITELGNDLYAYLRMEDIDELNQKSGLTRKMIISQDGPASYIKEYLNKMTEEYFEIFLKYHYATCERKELLGAGSHILDILIK